MTPPPSTSTSVHLPTRQVRPSPPPLTLATGSTPDAHCECVRTHSPAPRLLHVHHVFPLGHGGPNVPENRVVLCPTAHANVHVLLSYMLRHVGDPPEGRVNTFTELIARRGYDQIVTAARKVGR